MKKFLFTLWSSVNVHKAKFDGEGWRVDWDDLVEFSGEGNGNPYQSAQPLRSFIKFLMD